MALIGYDVMVTLEDDTEEVLRVMLASVTSRGAAFFWALDTANVKWVNDVMEVMEDE